MSHVGKKVLLLYADKYYLVNQVYPFGLDLISNYLRKRGHTVQIKYPFLPHPCLRENIREIIDRVQPDIVGVGIRNLDTCMSCEKHGDFEGEDYRTFYFLPEIREIVAEVRHILPHIPIVAGGGAFSLSPVAILRYLGLSYGIVGEGEEPFCELVESFPAIEKIRQISNLVYLSGDEYVINSRKPYMFHSDLSMSHREPGFDFAYQSAGVPVWAKRGCNQRCSYCVEPLIEGRKFVFRSIPNVIEELKGIAENHNGARRIFFVDTEFNVPDLTYCSELVRAILKEGLNEQFRFVTQFIPKPFNEEFAALLAEAGFSVVFSCESFADSVLAKNNISYKERDIIQAMETCESKGIHCTTSLIFGLPGETYETIDHTLRRMKELPSGPARTYEYTVGGRIYQGTPLCEFVERNKPSDHLYGTKSEGFLLPYYYCSPGSPFAVNEYVSAVFPELTSCEDRMEEKTHKLLAISYLTDEGLLGDATASFVESDLAVQSGIYDYLFKKLLDGKREDFARTISHVLLEKLQRADEPVAPGQADMVRFYLSCLR